MQATIVNQTEDSLTVKWESSDGFGNITFTWNGARYELDSEYLSIETVIRIIQALPKLKDK